MRPARGFTAGHVIDCAGFRPGMRALRTRLRAHPERDTETFLRQAVLAADSLPLRLRQLLYEFRVRGNRDGYLLLRGMPAATGREAEAVLALVGSRLGDFAGYLQENNGALFHDVRPERTEEYEQAAAGSRVRLALHTERCFHPHLPSHVLLFCLRPDHGNRAATEVASVRRILPLIPGRHLPVLYEPAFRTGIDYSFGNTTTQKANGPVRTVLYGDPKDPCLRYDLDLMAGLTVRARAALNAVKRAARRVCVAVRLAAGDIIIIDNRRAVHGRSAFTPRYDGRDRWLKRAYLVTDLGNVPDRLPGGRVICTRF